MSKQYQSTRVNPDKYIDKLKLEIERLRRANKDHWRKHGEHQFRYSSGVGLSVKLNEPTEHPKLLPGTNVIFAGHVTKVNRDMDGGSMEFAIKECKRVKSEDE